MQTAFFILFGTFYAADMDDDFLKVPIYAIFIGANLGIGSLVFLEKYLGEFASKWFTFIIVLLVFSATTCVVSSKLFINSVLGGKIAIYALILGYLVIFILTCFVPGRAKEIGRIRQNIESSKRRDFFIIIEKIDDLRKAVLEGLEEWKAHH